ncbi:protein phosphatase 2C domain-containing protein [Streptomyces sp. NPDC056231]|uniref:protein phosphatase 2C domain-containing protein n=1 Tax=Streptomyces sp. NPDC056231 TaxID=3345755 RepID=UPI003AAF8FF7
MSQQGERPAAHEDDWWRRLYDETAADAGASRAADSLDDRFDSASAAVGPAGPGADAAFPEPPHVAPADGPPVSPPPPAVPSSAPPPPPLSAPEPPPPAPVQFVQARAPWEPPVGPTRPSTFVTPPPAKPPSVAEASPVPVEAPTTASVPPLPRRQVSAKREAPGARPATPLPAAPIPGTAFEPPPAPAARPGLSYVGDRPPTYDAEPTALPATVPQELDGLVPDTVLDGARYGTYTLRAASVRGDSARFRGEPRRDALLTVRFGAAESALVLVAVASGARATEGAHLAAADACRWIGEAVGRSHLRLSEDIRAGRRGDLKSGLHRLTDRSYGKLRARAVERGLEPEEYTAGLRCLLLSADPACRTRVFFGVGGGGLFRLRDGVWQDLEPDVPDAGAMTGQAVVGFGSASPESRPDRDLLTMDLGIATPPSLYVESPPPPPAPPFRFRASVARPGDTLLLCSTGLAEPLRGEPALAEELAERWTPQEPPGLAAFLADTQLRVKGYAGDRTSVGVWEA